jgi:hypothetical protein
LFYSAITWLVTPICISMRRDELWRNSTSCDELLILYCGGKYRLYFRCNDWYFYRHITRIEMCMCKIVWHDELRRYVTSFEFRIAVENICPYCRCNEWHICRHILDDLNVDVYIRAAWRAETGCDELLIPYCCGKYRLYFSCWYICRHITHTEMWMCKIVGHDEFEFRIAVESIYCRITNVTNDTFVVTY